MKVKIFAAAFIAAGMLAGALPAHAKHPALDEATVQARMRIFGFENVDPRTGAVDKDKVVMSWLTHNAMAVSISGRVFLAESFVRRIEVEPGRTPFVIKDLVDLMPEAIFLGHGHRDHADNAAFIAAKTGAKIFATEETCGVMQIDLERMKADPFMQADAEFAIASDTTVDCTSVTTAGSTPGTQVLRLDVLEPEVCIISFRHLHSTALPPDPDWQPEMSEILERLSADGALPLLDWPDPRDSALFPEGIPLTPSTPREPGQQDLRTVGAGNPGGAPSLWFQFVAKKGPNFTFAYNNTVGAVKEGKGNGWDGTPEDGERVLSVLESLPYADVQFGTSSSGNTDFNGWRDHVYYLNAVRPRIFMPGHAPTGTTLQYFSGFTATLNLMEQPRGDHWPGFPREQWPELRWLVDPTDTLKPMVFDINDKAWKTPGKKERVAQFCSKG